MQFGPERLTAEGLRELFQKQAELNKRIGFDRRTAGIWLNNYLTPMDNDYFMADKTDETEDDNTKKDGVYNEH